jgi:predicted ArsR family transcriptional regulator
MPKLTDTQLITLSAAAQRDGAAALPLPESLKIHGGAVARVLKSLIAKGLVAAQPAAAGAEAWRETEDGERVTLVITDAGLQAIGVEPDQQTMTQVPADNSQPKARRRRARQKTAYATPTTEGSPPAARPGTKQATLIDLLRREQGATIAEIGEATSWQAHPVRGAISGALKKKLGLHVTSNVEDDRGRVYRLC